MSNAILRRVALPLLAALAPLGAWPLAQQNSAALTTGAAAASAASAAASPAAAAAPDPAAAPVVSAASAPAIDPARLARFDQAIAAAVRATAAEMPALPPTVRAADFGGGPLTPGGIAQQKVERAFEAATVPGCLGPDALKHAPPVVKVAGIPIVFGGVFSLPFLAYAVSTGKCK